jgi:crotonobetainyl-CoA:carnitine CoA-transferase CaiB-like acyl-CoA transferase
VPHPLYGQYQAKDNRWLLFSVLNLERYAARFFTGIGRKDLISDPRFETAEKIMENKLALTDLLKAAFKEKTLEEWKDLLNQADIPYSPVQTHLEVVNDPQARANGFFISYEHPEHGTIEGVANPIHLSGYPEKVRMPAPEFSQHTEEILLENGCTWEDIARLKETGVIY